MLVVALLACGQPSSVENAAGAPGQILVQLLEAAPGDGSTASIPTVTIGTETRPVVLAHPRHVLRWQEEVTLGDRLDVTLPLPPALRSGRPFRIDAWASVRHMPERWESLRDLFGALAHQTRIETHAIDPGSATGEATVSLEVPESLRGQTALFSAVARALPEAAEVRAELPIQTIPDAARLEFGFGVEREAWDEGWPPVHFSVVAIPETGPATTLFERRLDPPAEDRDRRWFDASVDLAALAGQRVRVRFEARALAAEGSVVDRSLPVWSGPRLIVPRPSEPARSPRPLRGVVLVSLDTLRAKSVGAYGNPRATSPTFDRRLAAEGARIATAVVPVPFTPPSHMTMLTGLDPCMHGLRDPRNVLGADRITLAERFRAAGFRTAAFTEDAYITAGSGFERGFDVYYEERSEEEAAKGFAAETFERALGWLRSVGEARFFLFVHTYQVHEPYDPPRGYASLFEGDGHGRPGPNGEMLDDYERELRYTDDLLAGFLDSLEAQGLADDVLLVVTSDHGEGFGEHGAIGHGLDMHDEALLVPLVLRAPGRIPAGRVIEGPIGLVDLSPTILDLAGLPAFADVPGRSFAGGLFDDPAAFEGRTVISTTTSGASVRSRSWKYIERAGAKSLLYALDVDPDERANLFREDHPEVVRARAELAEHRAMCERWNAAHPTQAEKMEIGTDEPDWMIDRDEITRKLRSLGYVE